MFLTQPKLMSILEAIFSYKRGHYGIETSESFVRKRSWLYLSIPMRWHEKTLLAFPTFPRSLYINVTILVMSYLFRFFLNSIPMMFENPIVALLSTACLHLLTNHLNNSGKLMNKLNLRLCSAQIQL